MNYSCGSCKHMKVRKGYLYPYKCKFNNSKSYGEEWMRKAIADGYKCEKFEFGFAKE